MDTESFELTLREEILLQVERLGKVTSSLESARINHGMTDKFIEWVELELAKVQVKLMSASISAERMEKDICDYGKIQKED